MPVQLNDAEAEQFVLQNGLLNPPDLESYKARAGQNHGKSLFDLLVAEGVISYDMLVQLEQMAQTAQAGAPRRKMRKGFDDDEPAAKAAPAPAPALAPAPVLTSPQPQIASPAVGAKPPALLSNLGKPPMVNAPAARPKAAPLLSKVAVTLQPAAPATAIAPAAPAALPATKPASGLLSARTPGFAVPSPAGASPPAAPRASPRPVSGAQAAPHSPPTPEPPPAPSQDHGHAEAKAAEPSMPQGWPGGMASEDPTPGGIQDLLKQARALKASDVHLSVGLPPMARVYGQLRLLLEGHPPLSPSDTVRLIQMTLTPEQWAYFDRVGDLDFCYAFPGGGRFRTNVLSQRNGLDMACRVIGERVSTLEELGLPPTAKRLTEFAQGLVLVTGPSGHGKTTTMMALVELVNQDRPDHVITVEDPIEFLIESRSCQVTQREVGPHTASFATALRAALREDPDIIMIGELRDYETTSMAINAAETGHLVFTSLPTQDAAKTIDKVLDYFPPEEQAQIRLMVSESLRGILSQQLIPKKDGSGRVVAVELLFNSVAVANIIRDANTAGLVNAMQLGKNAGMLLMDDSLMDLATKGIIAGEEAYARATAKPKFAQFAPKDTGAPAAAPQAAARVGGVGRR